MSETSNGHTVAIETVEVEAADGPGDPAARRLLEQLIARWLVRAYVDRYGNENEESVQSPAPRISQQEASPLAPM